MSSGQKSPSMHMFLTRLAKEPQLPLMSPQGIAKSKPKAPSTKPASSIAALYGVASSGSKDPMSQVTISDADVEDADAEDIVVSQVTIVDSQYVARNGYYFDHNQCCLVKVSVDGDGKNVIAMPNMKPGPDGRWRCPAD